MQATKPGWHTIAVTLAGLALLVGVLPGQATAPESEPLRILGRIPTRLERVSRRPDDSYVFTLFVGEVRQGLEPGDELRVLDSKNGKLVTAARVTRVARTVGGSGRLHVCVRLERPAAAPLVARLAASSRPGFPESRSEREAFVAAHGAEVVLAIPFEPGKGDDPCNFVQVVQEGIGATAVERALDTTTAFELRFSRPIDLASLRGLRLLTGDHGAEMPVRVSQVGGDRQTFRIHSPPGLLLQIASNRPATNRPVNGRPVQPPGYCLEIAEGQAGVRSDAGATLAETFEMPVILRAKLNVQTGMPAFRAR